MAQELAFVLINPYTIAKSRTGGVIARFMGRTDLNFVGARMFGPSRELAEQYAELVRSADPENQKVCDLIANYIVREYGPNPATGRPRRVMLLLFEGEDAIQKIWNVTGSATLKYGQGETIRDTFGDYILSDNGDVQYFEPAVLVAPSKRRASATLKLWAKYSARDAGLVETAFDVPAGDNIEKTLVLLKPDNFRFPSFRPGNIIDLLSLSGLRIVAVKKFCMTVAQAEEFYGPVRNALKEKFRAIGLARAASCLSNEFGINIPMEQMDPVCDIIGPIFAETQFESIVNFMTGYRPSQCSEEEKKTCGKEGCLALIYEGVRAVDKIRAILGSTDPSKAKPGSVRKEFGSNIMVNAAHASDSVENAKREMKIINLEEDTIKSLIDKYYGLD